VQQSSVFSHPDFRGHKRKEYGVMSAARASSVAGEKDLSKVSGPHHAGNYDHECDTHPMR
jgi:hypothetical protein